MGTSTKSILWHLLVDEGAPTLAEYGLLLALLALVAFVAIVALGDGISTLFESTAQAFTGVTIPSIP